MFALHQPPKPLQRPFQDFEKRVKASTDLSKPRNGFANNCLNDKKCPWLRDVCSGAAKPTIQSLKLHVETDDTLCVHDEELSPGVVSSQKRWMGPIKPRA